MLSATAIRHTFKSEHTSVDYGKEWDAQLQVKRGKFSLTFRYADYTADRFATDTKKVWLQLEYVR